MQGIIKVQRKSEGFGNELWFQIPVAFSPLEYRIVFTGLWYGYGYGYGYGIGYGTQLYEDDGYEYWADKGIVPVIIILSLNAKL